MRSRSRPACHRGASEIEITETALIRDFNRTLAMLRQTVALGIATVMDDFVGPAIPRRPISAQAFPSDRIKIDRSSSSRSIPTDRPRQSCGQCSASVVGWACRYWPKASRRATSCNACRTRCATRQGYLLGARPPSAASVTSPMTMSCWRRATIPSCRQPNRLRPGISARTMLVNSAACIVPNAGRRRPRQIAALLNRATSRYDAAPAFGAD